MKLGRGIEEFLLACRANGLQPRTVETYDERLRRLDERLGHKELASVTIHDLRAYADFLYGEDLSIVTVHGHLRSLRRLYNWMMEEGLVTDNLAQRIQLPGLQNTPPKAIAIKDILQMFLAALDKGEPWEQKRNFAMLLFMIATGCRIGGLMGLRISDLDLRARRAIVLEKNGDWRFVFFSEDVAEVLREWLRIRDEVATDAGEALWVSRRGTPLTVNGAQKMLSRLKEHRDIEGRTNAHAFRHRYAIAYLLQGGNLASLADLLGHKDLGTTRKYYARFAVGELQEQHDRYSILPQLLRALQEMCS